MGGYLTVPESGSDHYFMNLFLDTHVGEPNEIAADPGQGHIRGILVAFNEFRIKVLIELVTWF